MDTSYKARIHGEVLRPRSQLNSWVRTWLTSTVLTSGRWNKVRPSQSTNTIQDKRVYIVLPNDRGSICRTYIQRDKSRHLHYNLFPIPLRCDVWWCGSRISSTQRSCLHDDVWLTSVTRVWGTQGPVRGAVHALPHVLLLCLLRPYVQRFHVTAT